MANLNETQKSKVTNIILIILGILLPIKTLMNYSAISKVGYFKIGLGIFLIIFGIYSLMKKDKEKES